MKKYLKISNKGLLDIRLIALMGGTTKADDVFKIGNFGTGLKYTLAYLLRNNIEFHIFVGTTKVRIHTELEVIGGQDFNIICIDNHRTSITTQMGNDWEPWMIVRELYSNALDEGEPSYEISDNVSGISDHTCFSIEATPEFQQVYNNWNKYFIVGHTPLFENKRTAFFPNSGPLRVYKQGILIHESEEKSVFDYDIKDAEINELREYKGHAWLDVRNVLMSLDDEKTIKYLLEHVKEENFEATLDFNSIYSVDGFSKAWHKVLDGTKIIHKKAKENLEARGITVDTTANVVVPEAFYKGLTAAFEGLGALAASKTVNDFYEVYDETLHDRIKKAQGLLEDAKYFMHPELTYIYGVFGDPQVLARVDLDQKKIYLSEKHLERDLFSICCTLVEENEHFKTGFSDCTRAFQSHFRDMYVNRLVEKSSVELL